MRSFISLAMLAFVLVAGYLPGAGPQTTEPVTSPAPTSQPAPTSTPTPSPAVTPEPSPEPEPEAVYDYTAPVPETEAVDEAWFADALFIGDSRTDGLRLYGGIRGADFLCYKGLSVADVMGNKQVIQTAAGKIGVLQGLEQKQYGKVYLMLGLNELGYKSNQTFADTYQAVVDKILELQPEADLYLQLLIPVNTEVCRKTNQPAYVTNEKIAEYNEIIRTTAAEKEVYLLDVGEAFVDETGEIPADASFDGIHFQKEGYKGWYEYLKVHTVEETT